MNKTKFNINEIVYIPVIVSAIKPSENGEWLYQFKPLNDDLAWIEEDKIIGDSK